MQQLLHRIGYTPTFTGCFRAHQRSLGKQILHAQHNEQCRDRCEQAMLEDSVWRFKPIQLLQRIGYTMDATLHNKEVYAGTLLQEGTTGSVVLDVNKLC